jgi:endonuclease/exonuclease/phosphatase family metal-dependent hydrolase
MSLFAHIITYNVHGLPWCANNVKQIAAWLSEIAAPILCLQEVFTAKARQEFLTLLSAAHYEVLIPHDDDVCWLPSGLLIAVSKQKYEILSSCFAPFLHYHNVEILANKGFFRVHLKDRITGRRVHIVNTHTQSDTEAAWIFGRAVTKRIRFRQAEQILAATESLSDPVLVVGDLNQETSLHGHLRFLHPSTEHPIRKATFFRTGEDLDHIAWLPIQWAPSGCGFCGILGPRLQWTRVHPAPWSDHAPVEAVVYIPPLPNRDAGRTVDPIRNRRPLDTPTMVVGSQYEP